MHSAIFCQFRRCLKFPQICTTKIFKILQYNLTNEKGVTFNFLDDLTTQVKLSSDTEQLFIKDLVAFLTPELTLCDRLCLLLTDSLKRKCVLLTDSLKRKCLLLHSNVNLSFRLFLIMCNK